MRIGDKDIGPGHPAYIIAEIGINHNGDLGKAMELIDAAADAGADAAKFQKRTLDIVVPEEQGKRPKETPWGTMKYREYKERLEFDSLEYEQLAIACEDAGLDFFASAWDVPSVEFLETFDPAAHKVASAMLTNYELLYAIQETGRPIIVSTGMSDMSMVRQAVGWLGQARAGQRLALMQCTGVYPADDKDIHLRVMDTLREFDVPVGYSNHSPGIVACIAAAARGADIIEAHICLSRSDWGSDQAASIEANAWPWLVKSCKNVNKMLGSAEKKFLDVEIDVARKLRYHDSQQEWKKVYSRWL